MRSPVAALLLTASLAAAAPASAMPLAPATGASVFGPSAPVPAPPEAAPELSSPTVLVKAASEAVAQEIAARHGLTVTRGFPWIGWYELATPPGTTDAAAARARLAGDADVEGTDALAPDERVDLAYTPKDPAWTAGNLQTGEQAQWHLAKANFPAAWDRTTGAGAQIGIVDSEFDTQHPDLQAKVRNAYNTANGTANYHTGNVRATPGVDSVSVLHGTHVAGIAAASTDNGLGVSGGGFDATFVPVRISTSFTPGGGNPVDAQFVGDLAEALGYMATQSVGVVTMSLGTTRNHPPLEAAIQALRAKGVTIIASAGNFQESNPSAPIYPASYSGVIAVANTQANDTIAPSSSNGNWVDVAAPGTNIFSTWDTRDPQMSMGQDANYNAISGTSMAAPLVAGLVGLMKAVRPDLSPDEVETILKGTARDLGSPGADPQFGAGLINASSAVAAAASYVRPAPPAPAPGPAPAPAPPAPPADTLAPKVSIAGLVTVAGRSVTVRFKCAEACKGTARLRSTKRRLLASKSFAGKAGKTVTVRLKAKKKLKARSTVIIEIAARDAAGNLATKAERRKLRR